MTTPIAHQGSFSASDYSRLAMWFIPAAIVTWGIHEFAHWVSGVALGYDMWITFNKAGPVQGAFDTTRHAFIVAMAGPVVTWLQATIALYLIRRSRQLGAYAFLFLACWMRALAMGISFLSHPNDEASASLLLGLPMWVLPAASVALLVALAYTGSKTLEVGWKGNVIAYLMASAVTASIVFADQLLFS